VAKRGRYGAEKRQRELKKKKKREEKLVRKRLTKQGEPVNPEVDQDGGPAAEQADETTGGPGTPGGA
jgi:hypothetical protein